jgi:hypothetical protein
MWILVQSFDLIQSLRQKISRIGINGAAFDQVVVAKTVASEFGKDIEV